MLDLSTRGTDPPSTHHGSGRQLKVRSRRWRPQAELLEGRCLLSTFVWTGGAKNPDWQAAANWNRTLKTGNGSSFPQTGDSAIFSNTVAPQKANVSLDDRPLPRAFPRRTHQL
jgi:hypothetical protein